MSATATEIQAAAEAPASTSADPMSTPPTAPTQSTDSTTADRSSAKSDKQSKGKEAKGKKAKDSSSKSAKDAVESSGSPSVAAHPRAARAVARAKGWGALTGFFLAGYLSLPTDTLAEAGVRALLAGSVCYVVAWAGAVFVWRRLVMIELKGREQQLLDSAEPAPAQSGSTAVPVERSHARAVS
jgi:hypothetical protein